MTTDQALIVSAIIGLLVGIFMPVGLSKRARPGEPERRSVRRSRRRLERDQAERLTGD